MKALVFNPFSGASGDMIISSLLSLGANPQNIKKAMELATDVEVQISKTTKNGISATSINVEIKKEKSLTFLEIIEFIYSFPLPHEVISNAISIFNILGKAEAKIHGTTLENLHFHELGQKDAIADIIGACVAFYELGFKNYKIYTLPISVGMGSVEFSHGIFPVPAPATLEILKKSSLIWKIGPVEGELLTPTGAAILSHFVNETVTPPAMVTKRIGYGAGKKDITIPNVLCVMECEIDDGLISDMIEIIETNVDNVTGEVLGNLIDELLKEGAKDVSIIPVTMKKNRCGHIIHVIVKPKDSGRLSRKIIEETGSLGVRIIPVKHRLITQREMNKVEIIVNGEAFFVSVKIAKDLNGVLLNISSEFEDCKKISNICGVPVRDIIRIADEKARWVFAGQKIDKI